MAYWLGVLFADGNVCRLSNNTFAVALKLKCTDYEHVEKFTKALQSEYHLGINKTQNGYHCAAAHTIYSLPLATDLIALGCTERKSLTLKWPKTLPGEYTNHFVRGYLDGDGCITFGTYSHLSIGFASTAEFISCLRDIIKTNVLAQKKSNGTVETRDSIIVLRYYGNQTPLSILDWIYNDSNASIRLDRKYALYEQFKQVSHLKPEERRNVITEFINSDQWKKMMECQQELRCPQKHDIPNNNQNRRAINQMGKIDGCLIRQWGNAYTAAQKMDQSGKRQSGNILKACRGNRRSAYGYKWEFTD